MDLIIPLILALSLVIFGLISIVIRGLVKAAISLGVVSAILTAIMFYLGAPLAAVFELSVCAGLITAVFISAISLTKPRSKTEISELTKHRFKRYIYLPFILFGVSIALYLLFSYYSINWAVLNIPSSLTVQQALWNHRQIDIFGQIIIIFTGTIGVLVLFKERNKK